MNNENLRLFDTLPPEEHRELYRRGGIVSGEWRRTGSIYIHVVANDLDELLWAELGGE